MVFGVQWILYPYIETGDLEKDVQFSKPLFLDFLGLRKNTRNKTILQTCLGIKTSTIWLIQKNT
jgi:hypothetical protein